MSGKSQSTPWDMRGKDSLHMGLQPEGGVMKEHEQRKHPVFDATQQLGEEEFFL